MTRLQNDPQNIVKWIVLIPRKVKEVTRWSSPDLTERNRLTSETTHNDDMLTVNHSILWRAYVRIPNPTVIKGLENVQFDRVDDFDFVVGEAHCRCSRFAAVFLSPMIPRL
jgi:hypothetical protein